jgi:hypothetical protein
MVQNKKYIFSFTGASALIAETLIVAEEYEKLQEWDAVQKSLQDKNLLNKIKQATFIREFNELKKRLIQLTPNQIHLMTHGSFDDAKAMIFLSLCKTYDLFNDFIVEVLLNKYFQYDKVLSEVDYIRFINTKSASHPELVALKDNTAKKVKQRIFTLLVQMGIISQTRNGNILKPLISNETIKTIIMDNPVWLACFLYSKEEIKNLLLNFDHVQK